MATIQVMYNGSGSWTKVPLVFFLFLFRINKKKMAFWAVRNCDTVDHREKYVKKLQEYVDVEVYSSVRATLFKKKL